MVWVSVRKCVYIYTGNDTDHIDSGSSSHTAATGRLLHWSISLILITQNIFKSPHNNINAACSPILFQQSEWAVPGRQIVQGHSLFHWKGEKKISLRFHLTYIYHSVPGKRPCTAFQGATVAASIQTYGILIPDKRPCGPKSQVTFNRSWVLTQYMCTYYGCAYWNESE